MIWAAHWACPVWRYAVLLLVSFDLHVRLVVHYHVGFGWRLEVAILCCGKSRSMGSNLMLDLPLVGASFAWTHSFCLLVIGMYEMWIVEVFIILLLELWLFLFLTDHFGILLIDQFFKLALS